VVQGEDDCRVDDLHFHDLRHAGATWAAQSGATIKELQDRLGHASSAAAMRYQHLATDRGRVIAANISAQAEAVFAAGAHRGHDAGPEAGNA